jgi:hypothetical protein
MVSPFDFAVRNGGFKTCPLASNDALKSLATPFQTLIQNNPASSAEV